MHVAPQLIVFNISSNLWTDNNKNNTITLIHAFLNIWICMRLQWNQHIFFPPKIWRGSFNKYKKLRPSRSSTNRNCVRLNSSAQMEHDCTNFLPKADSIHWSYCKKRYAYLHIFLEQLVSTTHMTCVIFF